MPRKVFASFVALSLCMATKGFAGDSVHDFIYDPATGMLSVVFDGRLPQDGIVAIIIVGPVPLGFPKKAPLWDWVAYMANSAQLVGHPRAFDEKAALKLVQANITRDSPILLYPPGLQLADFGQVEYSTSGDLRAPADDAALPTVVVPPRTVRTRLRLPSP